MRTTSSRSRIQDRQLCLPFEIDFPALVSPLPSRSMLCELPEACDLLSAFRQVRQATGDFTDKLRHAFSYVTLRQAGQFDQVGQIERACQIFGALEYRNAQPADETLVLYGAISVSPALRLEVDRVNAFKQTFKQALKALRQRLGADDPNGARNEALTETLHGLGLARMHMLQTARRITMLSEQPRHMGFSISRAERCFELLSLPYVRELLRQAGGDVLAFDERCASCPDLTVVRVQPTPENMICNVSYMHREGYQKLRAPMPLLFPRMDHNRAPSIRFPSETAPKPRKVRAGTSIDREPLIPGSRIFVRVVDKADW